MKQLLLLKCFQLIYFHLSTNNLGFNFIDKTELWINHMHVLIFLFAAPRIPMYSDQTLAHFSRKKCPLSLLVRNGPVITVLTMKFKLESGVGRIPVKKSCFPEKQEGCTWHDLSPFILSQMWL